MKKIIFLSLLATVCFSSHANATGWTQTFKITEIQISGGNLLLYADRNLNNTSCTSLRWVAISLSDPTAKSVQANALVAQINENLVGVNIAANCLGGGTYNTFTSMRLFNATE